MTADRFHQRWRSTTLGEELTFQRGFDITKKEQQSGPFPVISSSGSRSMHSEFRVRGPGVVVGRKGKLGTVFYCECDFWPHDTTLWVKDFHGNHERFAYYFLQTLHLEQYDCGASNPTLNRNHIHLLPIVYPPGPTQHKIAAILSAYDDLIENNIRRIAILEEIAQNLYCEWFVRFRFPGHECVPLVDSALGPIPLGWHATTLADILTTLESGSRPKGGIDPDETEVPSIGAENVLGLGQHDFSKEKYVSREFFQGMRKGHVQDGDVALYKDGARLGRKALFRDGFPHQQCCVNEHVFLLRSHGQCSQTYLYLWLDLSEMTQAIINLNTNAAQPGISMAKVKTLPILLPDNATHAAFDTLSEPLMASLYNLAKKNIVLRRTRDLLLPPFISGKLDVSELDSSDLAPGSARREV